MEIYDVCITKSDIGYENICCMYHQEWYRLLNYMISVSPRVIHVIELYDACITRMIHIIELYDVCITLGDMSMYLSDRCITRYVCDVQYRCDYL